VRWLKRTYSDNSFCPSGPSERPSSPVRRGVRWQVHRHARSNPATSNTIAAMPIEVEVNLKIPSLTVHSPGKPDQRIDNSSVRFSRRITVEAVPKPGDWLPLSTRFADPFECTVTRVDWNDEKNLFVVSCTYSRRSITGGEHDALLTDPDWATKQLR
jgi:hypothetical protein